MNRTRGRRPLGVRSLGVPSLGVPSLLVVGLLLSSGCRYSGELGPDVMTMARADSLAHAAIIADANILTPYRLTLDTASVWSATGWGEFDHPRAMQGGLDVAVMGMLIPSRHEEAGDAVEVATARLDEWHGIVEAHPDRFRLLRSPDDVRNAAEDGVLGLVFAIENGIPIGSGVEGIEPLYDRGVRLITLVHSSPNGLGDSSYSQERPWGGLSPLGRDVVGVMNRRGMIIDVSHMADPTVADVLEVSRAPVIASHSSVRAFTPGWERNLSDELIEGIARGGGVIHVAFGGSFLSTELQQREQPMWDHVEQTLGLSINSLRGRAEAMGFRADNGVERATISDLADHVDHIVDLVGVGHVGLGSGFDGSGDAMLDGLRDVSGYPALIAELMRRGYGDEDLEKLLGGNFLRVWSEVESLAGQISGL